MNSDRIKAIQQATAYPESVSVMQALEQVWNECEQEKTTEVGKSGSADCYNWISVEKKLPEKDQLVLMFHNFGDSIDLSVGVHDRFWEMNNVTHWMLIPEPPV